MFHRLRLWTPREAGVGVGNCARQRPCLNRRKHILGDGYRYTGNENRIQNLPHSRNRRAGYFGTKNSLVGSLAGKDGIDLMRR